MNRSSLVFSPRRFAGVLAVPKFAVASLALIAACLCTTPAHAVTIDWVTVGNPGNTADSTGYGAVADRFQVMKFEFTNSQYSAFLNAVDPNGENPYGIYNEAMGSDARGGISFTSGNSAGSKYAAKSNMGNKPVNHVSWFDAARVSNWLHNGQGASGTETGAYTLVDGQTIGTAPARNTGAQYFIPTENQWYKAAYYKGGNTNAGYWDFATQSDIAPTPVNAGLTGIGSAGSAGNFANFNFGADWSGQNGNVTTVGTNGGASYYGAFDMSGNVAEWNDFEGFADSSRAIRGGSWREFAIGLSSGVGYFPSASAEDADIGFRLASPVPVPEPSTFAMALAGLACGGFSMWRRRKRA